MQSVLQFVGKTAQTKFSTARPFLPVNIPEDAVEQEPRGGFSHGSRWLASRVESNNAEFDLVLRVTIIRYFE